MNRFNVSMSLQLLVFTVQAGIAAAWLTTGEYILALLFALSTVGSGLLILKTWSDRPLKGFTAQMGMPIIHLTGYQLRAALEFIAPDEPDDDQMEAQVSLQYGTGLDGLGWYAWHSDYPEEGAILLDEAPQQTKEAAA